MAAYCISYKRLEIDKNFAINNIISILSLFWRQANRNSEVNSPGFLDYYLIWEIK